MAVQQSRNVSLNAELNAYIDARIASGDYNSASELMRAAVRLLRKREPVGPIPVPASNKSN